MKRCRTYPTSRERIELRRLLVHEAGCAECRVGHDDELRRDLVWGAFLQSVRIPRSLRRFLPERLK